jgi:hypothetical protein
VSVSERGHDSGRLLLKVYDDHQPSARPHVLLEETHPLRPSVCFAMVRRGNGVKDSWQVVLKLPVATARVENVQDPGVLEEDDPNTLGRSRLGEDRPVPHALAPARRAGPAASGPARSVSWREGIAARGYLSARIGALS